MDHDNVEEIKGLGADDDAAVASGYTTCSDSGLSLASRTPSVEPPVRAPPATESTSSPVHCMITRIRFRKRARVASTSDESDTDLVPRKDSSSDYPAGVCKPSSTKPASRPVKKPRHCRIASDSESTSETGSIRRPDLHRAMKKQSSSSCRDTSGHDGSTSGDDCSTSKAKAGLDSHRSTLSKSTKKASVSPATFLSAASYRRSTRHVIYDSSPSPPRVTFEGTSWKDPKSKHFDAVKFLTADECQPEDPLLELPPANYQYLDRRGRLKNPDKYNTRQLPQQKAPLHPKLAEHIRNDTATSCISNYYGDLPVDRTLPIAGIIHHRSLDALFRDVTLSGGRLFKLPESEELTTNIVPQEETFMVRPTIKLVVPDVIKAMLVDDWENVTKNQQLVPVPHPKRTAHDILEDYVKFEQPKRVCGSAGFDILEEVVAGLKEYFDKCLGRILLYRYVTALGTPYSGPPANQVCSFERSQYLEVRDQMNNGDFAGKTHAEIYGAEHLCRLLGMYIGICVIFPLCFVFYIKAASTHRFPNNLIS